MRAAISSRLSFFDFSGCFCLFSGFFVDFDETEAAAALDFFLLGAFLALTVTALGKSPSLRVKLSSAGYHRGEYLIEYIHSIMGELSELLGLFICYILAIYIHLINHPEKEKREKKKRAGKIFQISTF